ncbi:hypothetical protein ACNS95_004771, partial [Salmonella enterica subsp. enterica serovar Infantis]
LSISRPDKAVSTDCFHFRMLRDFDASEQHKTCSDNVVSEVLGTFGASLSSPSGLTICDVVTNLF